MVGYYQGSKAAILDMLYHSDLKAARDVHLGRDKRDVEVLKSQFISGLERAIKQKPDFDAVTTETLHELIKLAQHDWDDINTLKALFRRIHEIRYWHPVNEYKEFEGK